MPLSAIPRPPRVTINQPLTGGDTRDPRCNVAHNRSAPVQEHRQTALRQDTHSPPPSNKAASSPCGQERRARSRWARGSNMPSRSRRLALQKESLVVREGPQARGERRSGQLSSLREDTGKCSTKRGQGPNVHDVISRQRPKRGKQAGRRAARGVLERGILDSSNLASKR